MIVDRLEEATTAANRGSVNKAKQGYFTSIPGNKDTAMINSPSPKRQIVMVCDAGHFEFTHSFADLKKFKPKLVQKRHHFTISTASDYFTVNGLAKQTGQTEENFGNVVFKELLDNALDACEAAGIDPEITVAYTDSVLTITDNGLGIPAHVVESRLDFNTRTSDKALYMASIRGCQRQALKTVLGIASWSLISAGDERFI